MHSVVVLALVIVVTVAFAHEDANAHKNKINAVEHQSSRQTCSARSQCSFIERFTTTFSNRWRASHNYANGQDFDVWWSNSNVFIDRPSQELRLVINKEGAPRFGKQYTGAELVSENRYGYGCYEVRMKPVNQEGVLSTFFLYARREDPLGGNTKSGEIDIEFVKSSSESPIYLQATYFVNDKRGEYHNIPLNFNPEQEFHNYAFKWTSQSITWYVDGVARFTASRNIPQEQESTLRIMMNAWIPRGDAANWGGHFTYRGPRSVAYKAVRFTKGENCVVRQDL